MIVKCPACNSEIATRNPESVQERIESALSSSTSETRTEQDNIVPERIFLKACHPASPNHNCTWGLSKDRNDSVEYIRADLDFSHPFGSCGYKYCDWPDGELRCNEPRSTPRDSDQRRTKELEQRVKLLLRYVDHLRGCSSYTNGACTCGFENAMREPPTVKPYANT